VVVVAAVTTEVVSGGRLAGRVKDPDGIAERQRPRRGSVGPDGQVACGGVQRGLAKKGEGCGRGVTERFSAASAVFAAARRRHSVANLCVRGACVCVCMCVCVCVSIRPTAAAAAFSRDRERQVPDGGGRRAQKLPAAADTVVGVVGGAAEAAERCGPPRQAFARYAAACERVYVCVCVCVCVPSGITFAHSRRHSSAGHRLTLSTASRLFTQYLSLSFPYTMYTYNIILYNIIVYHLDNYIKYSMHSKFLNNFSLSTNFWNTIIRIFIQTRYFNAIFHPKYLKLLRHRICLYRQKSCRDMT